MKTLAQLAAKSLLKSGYTPDELVEKYNMTDDCKRHFPKHPVVEIMFCERGLPLPGGVIINKVFYTIKYDGTYVLGISYERDDNVLINLDIPDTTFLNIKSCLDFISLRRNHQSNEVLYIKLRLLSPENNSDLFTKSLVDVMINTQKYDSDEVQEACKKLLTVQAGMIF